MNVTRILWNQVDEDPHEVNVVNLFTDEVVICDLERAPDGTVLDGRFGLAYFMQFWDGDKEIPIEDILELPSFFFNGEEVKVGSKENPATLNQFVEIVQSIPKDNNIVLN